MRAYFLKMTASGIRADQLMHQRRVSNLRSEIAHAVPYISTNKHVLSVEMPRSEMFLLITTDSEIRQQLHIIVFSEIIACPQTCILNCFQNHWKLRGK
mmetsp:Transcript_68632/g.102000  ORF Transcript_68632/g.102000 Transcript_68632/m.102000 type:complete len:98 (+) Transcript_68632:114-407(+)